MTQSNRTLPIIWAALTVSHLFHLAMGELSQKQAEEADPTLVIGLCIAGLSTLILSLFVVPKNIKATKPEQLTTIFIIQWVLIESTGIFGLIARFMGAHAMIQYGMMGLAFVGMLFTFPSDKVQRDMLQGGAQ